MGICVYEDYEWQPGANTWMYLPFNGNYNNGGTLSLNWVSGGDVAWETAGGVKGLRFKKNSSSWVSCSGVSNINSDFTINMYVYIINIGEYTFMSRGTTNSTDRVLHVHLTNTSKMRFGFYSDDLDTNKTFSAGAWYNVVCSYKYSTKEQKIYVNGLLDNTRTASGNPNFGTSNMVFGKFSSDNNNAANGILSRFIFENRLWSDNEIKDYSDSTKALYGIS